MSFARTTSIAFAASIVTTFWSDGAIQGRIPILDGYNERQAVTDQIAAGVPSEQALHASDSIVQSESVMLTTNHVFALPGVLLFAGAALVWLAPGAARAQTSGQA